MSIRFFAIACTIALCGAAPALYAQSAAMRSAWDGVYTVAQANHGKQLFEQNCAKCHGSTLDGMDEIPALKGSHFMADWEQQSLNDLMDRIHSTMPMDNPGALNVVSATDVVAYLLQQNGIPAGNAALQPGLLTTFRIDPTKPGT